MNLLPAFERGVGEMHESYGHRAESIMEKTFSKLTGDANLWKRFIRYDKTMPGKAACGNVHFAPNSQADYDWANKTPVRSECYDWLLNFPNFKGDVRSVNTVCRIAMALARGGVAFSLGGRLHKRLKFHGWHQKIPHLSLN